MNNQFLLFTLFNSLSLLICLVIFMLSYIFSQKEIKNTDSFSPYECGFEAFGDARNSFDVKFYLVGILFLIFDLELIFFIPWAVSIVQVEFLSFFTMFIFLVVLTIGFIYEWKKGALDW